MKALKERLRRLNVTYMAGNLNDAEYLQQDAEIKLLIAKAEQDAPLAVRNLEPIRELLRTNFEKLYVDFDEKEKQRFWRSLVKEIIFDGKEIVDVKFVEAE